MISKLRILSVVEASSYLLLLAAMVAKYGFDNEAGVKALGPVHGILYLVYAAALVVNAAALGWGAKRLVSALFLGALPFGGFLVDRWWLAPLMDDKNKPKS